MTVLEPVIGFLQTYCRKSITLDQIIEGAERPRKPVLRVMDRLAKEGYLLETADSTIQRGYSQFGKDLRNPTWKILKKPLLVNFAPRPKKNALRDCMWRLIRARRRFTRRELSRLSGASQGSCGDYTKLLEKHGFLRVTGNDGHQKVFMLIKDPGPTRPATPEVKKHNVK